MTNQVDKYKIMIIEDHHDINDMYSFKFKKEGFDVKSSYDWLSAMIDFWSFKPDAVLLDIMMPTMNWLDSLVEMKKIDEKNWNKTKFIIFSNLNDEETIKKSYDYGADLFLLKAEISPKLAVDKIMEMLNENSIYYHEFDNEWKCEIFVKMPDSNKKIKFVLTMPN